jgi:hypothetical protein
METMAPGIGTDYSARLKRQSLVAPRPQRAAVAAPTGQAAPADPESSPQDELVAGGKSPEEVGYSSPAQRCHSCEYRDERAGEDQPYCSKFSFPVEDGGGCRYYEAAVEDEDAGPVGLSEMTAVEGQMENVA